MNWLSILKWAVPGLVVAALVYLAIDRFEQKAQADAAAHCAQSAADRTAKLNGCLPQVEVRLRAERKAWACNQALLPRLRDETRFDAAQACSAGVRRLIAQFDAAEAERDNARDEADRTRASLGDAVTRAERRGQQSTKRQKEVGDVIDTAPRDGSGRITCDAECMQRLAN